jgi:ketosteroid isomerase-like protein
MFARHHQGKRHETGAVGDNGEIAQRGLDAFLRLSFEEAQRLCAPDVEIWTLFDQPGHEPEFRGREGLRQWFERLRELWAFAVVQEVEVTEPGDGWVLMRVSARLRGRGSPHEFEPRVSVAIRVVDRLIVKVGLFADEASARAMIGDG